MRISENKTLLRSVDLQWRIEYIVTLTTGTYTEYLILKMKSIHITFSNFREKLCFV